MDRVKVLGEYQKLIERLYSAEEWLGRSKYDTWEQVKDNQYKIYHERENILSEIEWMKEELLKLGLRGNY